ncbi:MAG: L-threonylcarbamoyladenylate synthase [Thermoplasmata archaeon]
MPARGPVARAAEALRRGGLVVYPTDTLYGLGADATNALAVERLLRLKARPDRQPISIAVDSYEAIEPIARLRPAGRRYARTHLPGPYTLLVRPSPSARRRLAPAIAGPDLPTVGVRIPDHPLARALAAALGRPVTATSANPHGQRPARSIAEARRLFGGRVAAYLGGDPPPTGVPSTLVDLTGPAPVERPRA